MVAIMKKNLEHLLTINCRAFAALVLTLASTQFLAAGENTLLRVENGQQVLELDHAALDSLPQISFETTTIWTEGKITFSGPPLDAVLNLVGLAGQSVVAIAANDYKITIPAAMIEGEVPIVATRMNGETFGLRQKGPLWIIFPFDRGERFQRELVYSKSIWQLTQIRSEKD